MKYDEIKKITTIADPNMSEKDIDFSLVIQKAILTGQCDKCKYLQRCENDELFNFPDDSWCVKNYKKGE